MLRQYVRRHFRRHCCRTPMQFSLWTACEDFAIAIPLLTILQLVAGIEGRDDLDHLDAGEFFGLAVIYAPVVETIVLQMIPIAIMRFLRVPFGWQVGIATFLFWLPHAEISEATGFGAGLIGGFYLGFGYAFWARQSHITAYWTTVLKHMLGNGASFILLLAFGQFSESESEMPDWAAYTIILGLSAIYWLCLVRDNSAFFATTAERMGTASQSIRPGMPEKQAKFILAQTGCECVEESIVESGWSQQRVVATTSVDPATWIVVDFEFQMVARIFTSETPMEVRPAVSDETEVG